MAAVATAVKKPEHVFVVPAARDAAQAADRVVTDLTGKLNQFEAQAKAISGANNDPSKIDAVVSFYDTVNEASKQGAETLLLVGNAIGKCHVEGAVLTSKRAPQFELLSLTKVVKDRAAGAQRDKEELALKRCALAETQGKVDSSHKLVIETPLAAACQKFLDSQKQYTSFGGVSTSVLYWATSTIDHYKQFRAAQQKKEPAAAPAKTEAPKASVNDAKAAEKPAAVVKSSEPNWNHPFLIDLTSADRAAIDTKHVKLSIEDQTKRAAKLPAAEAAEKAKGLQGKEAILSDVALWTSWELENRRANNVIGNMQRAVEACDQACLPLSDIRAGVLRDLGLEKAFEENTARVKADKEELQKRIAKLSELQKTVDPAMTEFTNTVGLKCFNFLYAEKKVWYYFSSYTGAIELFRQEYTTELKGPLLKPPVMATAATATTVPSPVVATDAKTKEPVKTAAVVNTAEPKPAVKAKTPPATFKPADVMPELEKRLSALSTQVQHLNSAALEAKNVTATELTGASAFADEQASFLVLHDPQRLLLTQVPPDYLSKWKQASSLVEGLNAVINTLRQTDSKHSKK